MIGVIGGSGLYDLRISKKKKKSIKTPFGKPSDSILVGKLRDTNVAFLARHGKKHKISPSEINYKANIFALKKIGVDKIISVQAVGSLKEEIKPLDIVIPDQIIDRTKLRKSTFFENGVVSHISFAEPFCPELSKVIYYVANGLGYSTRLGGTYLCIEGPQFSTRAESLMYQSWGAEIIGMTALPEAKLAREAEICYAALSTVTDYDVWKEQKVNVGMILENMKKNEEAVANILKEVASKIDMKYKCDCKNALAGAIVTAKEAIPKETKKKLNLLISRYV